VALVEPISITGLREFMRDMKTIDRGLPKVIRLASNESADIIVGYAQPRVPSLSGKARRTIKAKSTTREVRVVGGSARGAPYYPWLDFGGRVGKNRSVRRTYSSDGRYLYPALAAKREEFHAALTQALITVCADAGIEVG
jgi:hypothetical protein